MIKFIIQGSIFNIILIYDLILWDYQANQFTQQNSAIIFQHRQQAYSTAQFSGLSWIDPGKKHMNKIFFKDKPGGKGFSIVELIISASLLLISLAFFSTILPNLKNISQSSTTDQALKSADNQVELIEKFYDNPVNWTAGNKIPMKYVPIGNVNVNVSTEDVECKSGLFSGTENNIKEVRIVIQKNERGRLLDYHTRSYYIYRKLPDTINSVRIDSVMTAKDTYKLTAVGISDSVEIDMIPLNWELVEGEGTFEYDNGVSVIFHRTGSAAPKIRTDVKYKQDIYLEGEWSAR